MPDCEECSDEVKRRVWCWHCGRFVCLWCWHHIHGCGPSHTRAECKHYRAYTSKGADSKRIWRAQLRNKLRKEGTIA